MKPTRTTLTAFLFVTAFAVLGVAQTLALPALAPIPNQSLIEDQPTLALEITNVDLTTPGGVLSAASSDTTLVPVENIFFGVAGLNQRYITVTPAFGQTGTATITVTNTETGDSTNTSFVLTVNPPPPGFARFVNTSSITIPDSGNASPYPSTINVSGTVGAITNLTLTFSKFSHGRVQDVNMLLVGPTGVSAVIFREISGNERSCNNSVTVTLTDASFFPLPADFDLWSEPLRPADYDPGAGSFPLPAPAVPYDGVALSTFNGQSANGTWSLYVYDDQAVNTGSIVGGWSLMVATSTAPTISDIPDQTIPLDTSTGPISFSVSDPDTDLNTLTFTTNSSNTALVPLSNIVLGGSGANRTVTVTPTFGLTGQSTITVTVSDGVDSATDTFLLTVSAAPGNTPPTISSIADKTTLVGRSVGPFNITVGDAESAAGSLTLSGSSSNTNLVPNTNIVFFNINGTTRTLTVTPVDGQTGTSTITVNVSDGVNITSTNFNLTVSLPGPGTAIFDNTNAITIANQAAASPYPSTNHASGLAGVITNLTLTLKGMNHSAPHDLEMLLVSPAGQKAVLFAHVGGGTVSNITVTLDDAAEYALPPSPFAILTGTYRPLDAGHDAFPSPAPGGPYGTTNAAFNGVSPNGDWLLYVFNDPAGNGAGSISGGWSLAITTDIVGTGPTISDIPNQTIFMDTSTGPISFTVSDPDTDLNSLTFTTNSSNTLLVPLSNIVLGGSGANRTVTVTPASGLTGTATITVTVSDGVDSATDTFVLTVNAPPTQVRVETAANGSGTVVPAQNISPNSSITVYAITRDASNNFVANVAADSWSLTNVTGGVINSDLVVAGNSKSATFTGHVGGSAMVHVTSGVLTSTDSGTLTVLASAPPTISAIADKATLVGRSVGPFNITVGDTDTPVNNLTLSGSSSNTNLVPNTNIVFFNINGTTRTLTVTPVDGQTGTATLTISVSDTVNTTSTNFNLTVSLPGPGTAIFDNTNALAIPTAVAASPYPSTNHVSGLAGVITNLTLTLKGMNHSAPHDLEMLLVSPAGQKAVLFAHVGGGTVSNITVTLDDAAEYVLPPSPFAILTGTYRPLDAGHDAFPSPAPGGPYGTTNAAFNGVSPNGDWLLYVFNDPTGSGAGSISGGWSLAITTDTQGTPPTISDISNQTTTVNVPTAAIPFVIGDLETAASNLVLTAGSSDPTVVPTNNVVFGGSDSNRTVTITPASNKIGSATITITVSDGVLTTNDSFVLTVEQGELTVAGITAANKAYDGTNTATIDTNGATLVGVVGSPDVSLVLSNASGSFDTKNVGTNKTVQVAGLGLSGADAGNYTLTQPTTLADITGKSVTVVSGLAANNKVYDGNTGATINSNNVVLSGELGGDAGNVSL
ncbi:MAG: hypothetical protein HY298_23325, partial [Verrucomicrobia bacterium]|nr:hypothetical protein [Verrucomicrobiota bacterium]